MDEEDRALFRQSIGKIRRLDQDKVTLKPKQPTKRPQAKRSEPLETPAPFSLEQEAMPVTGADFLHYAEPGVQPRLRQKLKQGKLPIEAKLDLHGHTTESAAQELASFLEDCLNDNIRCALIIHGKGYRAQQQHPILKTKVNTWLQQHSAILAFCSAPANLGGTGAVLALLRRGET